MVMVRKQIYVRPETERTLKAEARRRGVPEAVVIRERLEHACSAANSVDKEAARKRFLDLLDENRRRAKSYKGPKRNWKFRREDAYEERLERQMPR